MSEYATGINRCFGRAAAALRFLAEHDRPIGGNDRYNSEDLHHIAVEIERTVQHGIGFLASLRSANQVRDIEWSGGKKFSLSYRGNEFAGEAGEVCNKIKKLEREGMDIPGSRTTIAETMEEVADVIITADLIAMTMGADLQLAVISKFNKTSEAYGLKTKFSTRIETFQDRVAPWMEACFGEAISNDPVERNHRFLEEAMELVQSGDMTREEAHRLVDYVFDRPAGKPYQETGGVMVTLAAWCLAHKLDMHKCGELELSRIWGKVEKVRAKQAAKPNLR